MAKILGLNEKVYFCMFCDYTSTNKEEKNEHEKEKHLNREAKPSKKQKMFAKQSEYTWK